MSYVVKEYSEGITNSFRSVDTVVRFLNNCPDLSSVDVLVLGGGQGKVLFKKTGHEFIELHS